MSLAFNLSNLIHGIKYFNYDISSYMILHYAKLVILPDKQVIWQYLNFTFGRNPSSILTLYPSAPYRLYVPQKCGTYNQHLIDNQRVAFHIEDGTRIWLECQPRCRRNSLSRP